MLRFDPVYKAPIMDAYVIPILYEYAFSGDGVMNEPSIFIIDNPGWTNTKSILEKFPKAKIDAVNYSFGENSKQYFLGNKNVKMYKWMSFDLLKKWDSRGKNKKYNLVYLDTEQVVNKTVNSLIYLKNMLSKKFNRIITVYSVRGKIGSITAIDGKSYTHHTFGYFLDKNGYKDMGRTDPYTSGYGNKVSMRLRVLVHHSRDEKSEYINNTDDIDTEPEIKEETPRKRKRIIYDSDEEDNIEDLNDKMNDTKNVEIKNLPFKKRILKRIEENDLNFKQKNIKRGNGKKEADFVELKNPNIEIMVKIPNGTHPLIEAKLYGKMIMVIKARNCM